MRVHRPRLGVPFAYIHFFAGGQPAALSLPAAGSSASAASGGTTVSGGGSVVGTWKATTGSQAGYRVSEVLLGQKTTAVGRTSSVAGTMTISGTTLTATTIDVDLRTVKSDKSQRDAQFQGRLMDTATYPTAVFTLTGPVDLAPLPAVGVDRSYTAKGTLSMHGQTHPVVLKLTAERSGAQVEVAGSIQITFATWGIANPSFGSFVTTGNTGTMEYLLVFTHA